MQTALGTNGQIIIDLIPQLGLIIGPQLPLPKLPPIDAQHRFHLVFQRFIGVFLLKRTIREGLLWWLNSCSKFLHDRVQEAAYALLPKNEHSAQHLQIGRLLLSHAPDERVDENIFEIVAPMILEFLRDV